MHTGPRKGDSYILAKFDFRQNKNTVNNNRSIYQIIHTRFWAGFIFFNVFFLFSVYAQRPYVSASFPRNGAINLQCNTFVSISLQFPAESQAPEPTTLNATSVNIYPKDEKNSPVAARIDYHQEFRTMTITPQSLLEPHTSYIFEVTENLVDDRGFGFMPFQLIFTTGDCQTEPLASSIDTLSEIPASADSVPTPRTYIEKFSAYYNTDTVEIWWSTGSEFMNVDFTVDRSDDGRQFRILDRIESRGDSQQPQFYSWLDTLPLPGANYYRLTMADIYGKLTHSDTLRVFIKKIQYLRTTLHEGDTLRAEFIVPEKTTFAFVLRDEANNIVRRKAGAVNQGVQIWKLSLDGIDPGRYIALLRTPEDALIEQILILE